MRPFVSWAVGRLRQVRSLAGVAATTARGRARGPVGLLALALLVGCGSAERRQDAGEPDAAPDGSLLPEPEPPAPPERPRMTPCPAGWREVSDPDDAELVVCDPWPEGGPQGCAADEAHFPGGEGCERIGSSCPEGDWATDIPGDATVLWVRAGEPGGGTGTQESPFGRISDAVRAADSGAIVAISKGTFDEVVTLSRPMTLWGACVAETHVTSSRASVTSGVVRVIGGTGAVVRNLRISGSRPGVEVSGAGTAGSLRYVLVEEATVAGLNVWGGGTFGAEDVAIRRTSATADGDFGFGFQVLGGGRIDLVRVVLEENTTVGALAQDPGSTLVATDTAIRDTRAGRGGFLGSGLEATVGARAELTRTVIQGNRNVGVLAMGEGTEVVASRLSIVGTEARGDGDVGYGLDLDGDARATIDLAVLERNRTIAIVVSGEETDLAANDVVIRDTRERERDGDGGYGMEISGGAQATISRVVLVRNRTAGILAAEEGTAIDATDLAVRDTLPRRSDDVGGYGIEIASGAGGRIVRAVFERNTTCGVHVGHPGTELVATDLAVRDTRSQASDSRDGDGVIADDLGRVEIVRAEIVGNRRVGILAFGGGVVACEDLVIENTLAQACADTDCAAQAGGIGLVAANTGEASATRFRIAHSVLCGLQLTPASQIDLSLGEVSNNPIGANVQDPDFDIARLQDRVAFRDNQRNLDSSALWVPDTIETLTR